MSQIATLAQDPTASASGAAAYQIEFQGLQNELRNTIGEPRPRSAAPAASPLRWASTMAPKYSDPVPRATR